MPDTIMNAPKTITPEAVLEKLQGGENAVIIDVREPDEYRSLHAAGAVALPLGDVDSTSVRACLTEGAQAYFICHTGRRANEACTGVLADFPQAQVIEGGTLAWAQAGLPVRSGDKP